MDVLNKLKHINFFILVNIVPSLSITLDCHQANDIHSFITSSPLLQTFFHTITIENFTLKKALNKARDSKVKKGK